MPDTNNTQYAGRPDLLKLRSAADVPVAVGVGQHFDAPIRQSVITIDAYIDFTKVSTTHSYGGLKVLDLPEGAICLLGASANLVMTCSETGVAASDFNVSIGTVTKVNADAAQVNNSTEENVMKTQAYTLASGVATVNNGTPKGTFLISDGNTTPIDLFLNVWSSSVFAATGTVRAQGTIIVTWIPMGDAA